MRKLIKIISFIILIAIIVFVIGSVLLVKFVNPNDFKNQINRLVYNKTGQALIIKGDMKCSFFPWLGLKLNEVTLNNPAGFNANAPFAEIGETDVSVQLLPLLVGKVDLGKVVLNDVTLNLIRNKAGQNNWQNMIKQQNNAPANPQPAQQKKTSKGKTINFTISSVEIVNANIAMINEQTGNNSYIRDLNLQTANVNFGKPFPINLKFTYANDKPAINAQVDFNSKVLIDSQQHKYALKDFDLTTSLFGKNLPKGKVTIDTNANIAVDLNKQIFSIANLVISSSDLQAQGELQGSNIVDKPTYQGQIQISQFDLRDLLVALGQPLKTQDPRVLQRVALNTEFIATNKSLQLNQLTAKVDDTNIKGNVAITDFATNSANFSLGIDSIDLDRYLLANSKTTASNSANKTSSLSANQASSSPFAALRKAAINGSFAANAVTIAKTDFSNITAQITANNGIIKISPMNAEVYGGKTKGSITVDARSNTSTYSINENLSNIQVDKLIKSERVTGDANVTADLTTSGNDANSILRSLNGDTKFAINNGVIHGIAIVYQLERAYAFIQHQSQPPADNTNQTEFSSLTGTGKFTNGVFTNNDLLMQSPYLRVTGNGSVNLVSQAINYHVTAVAMHKITDNQGKTVLEPRQTEIPLLITGTFDKPAIVPDFAALGKTLFKNEINQQIDKALGGNSNDAVKNLGNTLKNLLQ